MKKFSVLALAALMSAPAFADSFTIEFLNGGESQSVINPANPVTTYVTEASAAYISSFAKTDGENVTRCYIKSEWEGIKMGVAGSESFSKANLTINFTAAATVKPTSIIVNGKGGKISVAGKEFALGAEFANDTVAFDGAELASMDITNAEEVVSYVKSITVVYEKDSILFDACLCHSPHYSEGKLVEIIPGPDMLDETTMYKLDTTTHTEVLKKGIATKYQWIVYTNPTSTLDNGQGEVQTANQGCFYDLNDTTLTEHEDRVNWTTWNSVAGSTGSKNKPVISSAWGKFITLYIKDTRKLNLLFTSSASKCTAAMNNKAIIVATPSDGSTPIEMTTTPGKLYAKSGYSEPVFMALDPTKAYMITIKGDATVNQDFQLTGIQIFGVDSVPGIAPHAPVLTYGYNETVFGTDMVKPIVAAADGKTYYLTAKDWIKYINPTSTLAEGTQVQTSNRWTSIDPNGQATIAIQLKTNGSDQAPVITKQYGKYIEFYVKNTSKFTVYATGSSSSDATCTENAIELTAFPYNSNDTIYATSTPGKIYGKGSSSDSVSVKLDPNEKYCIRIETLLAMAWRTKNGEKQDQGPDMEITGINLWTTEGEAMAAEGNVGTLNMLIANSIKSAADTIEINLEGSSYTTGGDVMSYSLIGEAPVGQKVVTIKGNNTGIVCDTLGQITTKNSLVLDGVKIDASASKVAPIAMAAKSTLNAADTTALYTEILVRIDTTIAKVDTTWAISKIDTTWKDETKTEISKIDTTYAISKIDTTYNYTAVKGMKYAGANQKVFEAQLIAIKNSTVKVQKTAISGGDAPWALRNLTIDNSILEFTNNKKADKTENISWFGGGNSIKSINMTNSTFYCDSVKNDEYFLRYSNGSNAQPQKVWGTNDSAYWNMNANTFVNISSTGKFANNYSDKNNVVLNFKNNVFANTYLLQKIGNNCVRNFTNADNAICGGANKVDSGDTTKFATEDVAMAANFDVTKPDFKVVASSWAAKMGYGDPRWAVEYVSNANIATVTPAAGDSILKDSLSFIQILFANADSIKATDSASVVIKMADSIVYNVNNAVVAGDTVYAAISAEDAAKLTVGEYTISVKAGSYNCYKFGEPVVNAEINSKFKIYEPVVDSIEEVETVAADGKMYNLAGQRVNNAKGLVIMNGRKMMIK